MEDALEAGAADFAPDEGVYTVYTDPDDVASVAEALTNDGYEPVSYTHLDVYKRQGQGRA